MLSICRKMCNLRKKREPLCTCEARVMRLVCFIIVLCSFYLLFFYIACDILFLSVNMLFMCASFLFSMHDTNLGIGLEP